MDTNAKTQPGLNNVVHALYAQADIGRRQAAPGNQMLGSIPLVADPAEIDELAKRPEQFRKNFSFVSALGRSRFNTNGREWAIRRDLTQAKFLAAGKQSRRAHVLETYQTALRDCEPRIDAIQDALFSASLRIFFEEFGLVPEIEPTVALLGRVRDVLRLLQLYSWITPDEAERQRTLLEARAIIRDFGELLSRDQRAVLEMQRFSREASEIEGFSPVEEFVMNLFAGVETTVAATGWVLDRIGINPGVEARIHDEVAAGGETPYMDCMINETMRFFPPIPFVIRETTSDIALGPRSFRKGQLLLISVVGAHQHPDYWTDPQVFDSSRREFMDDTYDRRAFIPFLTGPRMCGGARLGRLEIHEGMRAIVPLFEIRRTDNAVRFDYGLALRPVIDDSLIVIPRG